MSKIEIELDRYDRIYSPEDVVTGNVLVNATNPWTHQGIAMKVEGSAKLQLSAKSVGIFEAFYNSVKPLDLVHLHIPVTSSGKVAVGETRFPFEFKLLGIDRMQLLETYHGVYITVMYEISVSCPRGLMKKNLQHRSELFIEIPRPESLPDLPQSFIITPDTLENVPENTKHSVPNFRISGHIQRSNCAVNRPFTGEIVVEEATTDIRSVEVQLIRIESITHAEGTAREATEIQNVQLAMGDVCRKLSIPIYMIFPRLFTCPTLSTRTFKVDFEINLVVLFQNGYMITENFPVVLYR